MRYPLIIEPMVEMASIGASPYPIVSGILHISRHRYGPEVSLCQQSHHVLPPPPTFLPISRLLPNGITSSLPPPYSTQQDLPGGIYIVVDRCRK